MASELAAFQAVTTTYGLTKAQAATYFVAVVLSTDPTSLGLSTTPNPGNPGGLSDQQTYINQFNAATNRAIVSGNFANQSANASNLNYPVAGPTTNAGYVGAQTSEQGVNNQTSTVVTAENQISVAAAANDPMKITGQTDPNSGYQLTPNQDIATANVFSGALIFNAPTATNVQTLTNGDTLTGSGTNPTLNAQLTNAGTGAVTTTVTTNGITTINLQNLGAGSGNTVTGRLSGVTTLSNDGSIDNIIVAGLVNCQWRRQIVQESGLKVYQSG